MSIKFRMVKSSTCVGLMALTLSACVLPVPPVAVKVPVAPPANVKNAIAMAIEKMDD